jgi:hypothetical protein
MNIIHQIIEAVYELETMNCKRDDMIIAFNPLIEHYLIREQMELAWYWHPNGDPNALLKIQGIKTYNLHPYLEIVVYDSKNCAYHPQLLVKIDVSSRIAVKNKPTQSHG